MAYLFSKLAPKKGSHPVSTTTIHLPNPYTSYEACSLHIYYILPPLLFVDTHELAQRSASYGFNYWGTKDLEKPVHALPDDISELLINIPAAVTKGVPVKSEEEDGKDINVEVPMHLRYGSPREASLISEDGDRDARSYEQLRVDWPKAFLLCPYSCTFIGLLTTSIILDIMNSNSTFAYSHNQLEQIIFNVTHSRFVCPTWITRREYYRSDITSY